MSYNDLDRFELVSYPMDEVSVSEEADDTSQDFDASTRYLGHLSIKDSVTPLPNTFHDPEPPKKACKTGRLSAVGHLALFHLPAVATTLMLVAFYSVHIRWGELSDEQLSYLQFAAKGHEALILISLTDILMHRIRYNLLHEKNGVPLGFLSSSFVISSPISYFFSWELWAPLLRPHTKSNHAKMNIKATDVLIIISIILSIAAAPLSAIAILPRSGWWQVHVPMDVESNIIYINGPLWERDLSSNPEYTYLDSSNGLVEGLDRLRDVIDSPPVIRLRNSTQQISNISFASPYRTISITLDFTDRIYPLNVLQQPLAVTTTLLKYVGDYFEIDWEGRPVEVLTRTWQKFLGDRFDSVWDSTLNLTAAEKWKMFRQAPTGRWKQPIVAVECSPTKVMGNTAQFEFRSGITAKDVLLKTKDNNDFKTFLEDTKKSEKIGAHPAASHLFLDLPYNHISAAILFIRSVDGLNGTGLSLCRIYSRWAEADTWIEYGESVYKTHLDNSLFDVKAHFRRSGDADDLITMSKDWLQNTSRQVSSPSSNSSYHDILNYCTEKDPFQISRCLTISLSVYMIHILSLTASWTSYDIISESFRDSPPPTPDDIVIYKEYFVGGYGYNWKSSRTIPFAFSVLLLHVLIAFAHMMVVLLSRQSWHSSSWSSFGQMMVLALRSKALDGLGSVGAGVSSSKTWSTSVSVRVVGDEDRLEMVLQNEKGGHSQYQEVGGEVEEEGFDRGLSLAQPGVKYH
ncbi:hypothetical protein FAUST_7843 [Fusarium austroamericanum]|uniref:Uncharacterized protein n=1 Tax=Fusarium austroamericanum TaxID=282268 RepID=A0AAN5Z6Q0_FUSAU|nr:hypothetical protein FAUST_7843 [Fusarium austroamericanum]